MTWACVKCGREATDLRLHATAARGFMSGYCLECRTHRYFSEGSALKESGMRLVETAEAIAGPWVEQFDAELSRRAASGEEFSAEDITAVVGRPSHPNAVGARINAAARKGLIEKVGVVKASRRERHANEMRLWRGT